MENYTENLTSKKQRHGCLTTWLIIMLIVNSFGALTYVLSLTTHLIPETVELSDSAHIFLISCSIANILFSVMLLKWKKIGFWGFGIISIVTLIYNISSGNGLFSLVGLLGVVLLYALLQIEKGPVKGWNNLE